MVRQQLVHHTRRDKIGRLALTGLPSGYQGYGPTPYHNGVATDAARWWAVVFALLIGFTVPETVLTLESRL